MINVGKCAGYCHSSIKPLYRNPVRSFVSQNPPLYYIKDIQTICAPIEFEDIETEIIGNKDVAKGPTIEDFVIRSCACTEVEICE